MQTQARRVDGMDRTKQVTEWESGLPETPCGNGSRFNNTEEIRRFIPHVIESCGIRTVADVGCGDQNWIHACLPDDVVYKGFDLMPRRQDVLPFDVTREVLPTGYDLVLCIYVLNHLHPDRAERALRLIAESGSGYLMMSYSNADEYSLDGAGELVDSCFHKNTPRHAWRYGLWKL